MIKTSGRFWQFIDFMKKFNVHWYLIATAIVIAGALLPLLERQQVKVQEQTKEGPSQSDMGPVISVLHAQSTNIRIVEPDFARYSQLF